jgi:hypothetical protein
MEEKPMKKHGVMRMVSSDRLFDADEWLRNALAGTRPDLTEIGKRWAGWGVTGITDMNPHNGASDAAWLVAQRETGRLPQTVLLAGLPGLAMPPGNGLTLGPVKVHLHEAHLPDLDGLMATIKAANRQGRGTAVHCVTEAELVFTLAAFTEAGTIPGDRIEHASLASDALVRLLDWDCRW